MSSARRRVPDLPEDLREHWKWTSTNPFTDKWHVSLDYYEDGVGPEAPKTLGVEGWGNTLDESVAEAIHKARQIRKERPT